MAFPPDQSDRSISFYLTGTGSQDVSFTFGLRPEEVSFQEPSRLNVQSTLGGAWADSFDRGVGTLSLSGTTGWRGTLLRSGEEMFLGLRTVCFQGWHDARARVTKAGVDPGTVQLYYIDTLDSIAAIVAPASFSMRRSKTSPLIQRYQIQARVLAMADAPGGAVDPIAQAFSSPLRWLSALNSLTSILKRVSRLIGEIRFYIGAVKSIITGFVDSVMGVINSVVGLVRDVSGVIGFVESTVIGLAIGICFAAANGFAVLADIPGQLAAQILPIQALAAAFNDAACSMEHGFDLIGNVANFDPFKGASGCSSTGGGEPISLFTDQGVNPFNYIAQSGFPLISVTPPAQQAIASLQGDPLLLRGQQSAVLTSMGTVSSGIVVAA